MGVKRLLMVGWDCADPEIVDSLIGQGKLPNLARVRDRGSWGRLQSTFPDTSLAAWTSAMTGVGPGRHGLVNFVRRPPGQYRLKLVDAEERQSPTLPALATRNGLRVASLGVPGTWPPETHAGVCIAGFDSPVATRASVRAHQPRELFAQLKRQGLYWPYGELDELAVDGAWHARALRILEQGVEQKRRVAQAILAGDTFDLAIVVFSESDTAAHHFWAFADQNSPRHRYDPNLGQALVRVYQALDSALGRLLECTSPYTTVMVLSDHGARGSSDHVVYINRWLARQGLLRFGGRRSMVARGAGVIRDLGSRFLPGPVKEAILRSPLARLALATDGLARFGQIDLARSQAFCDELPQNPGIWIHRRGRDPLGPVSGIEQYHELRRRIARGLLDWRDPESGRALVARVLTREEATPGPAMERSPDLLLELASWPNDRGAAPFGLPGYRLSAAHSASAQGPLVAPLAQAAHVAGKGSGTSGAHSPHGILVAGGGPAPVRARFHQARLEDVCPTALAVLGLDPPGGLDGRVLPGFDRIATRPSTDAEQDCAPPAGGGTARDEEAVRKRLKGLGYL